MSVGNRKADEVAKRAAQKPLKMLLAETEIVKMTPELLTELQSNAPKQERQYWEKKGAKQNTEGTYI